MSELKVYGDSRSGNCYKLKLLCSEMELTYKWQEIDILAGESRTNEFLAMNPNGRIPLLELPDCQHLAESNAILSYLADGSEYAGRNAWDRAQILQWMFFEQYSHEPYIATSRFIIKYLGNPSDKQSDLVQKKAGGESALKVMEQQLQQHAYFVGEEFTIADVALFAYTHVAEEGGFTLDPYPAIGAWIERIQARPRFIPMT